MIIEITLIHLNLEMNTIFCMILFESKYLRISFLHDLLEVLLIIFSPFVNGELFDVDCVLFYLVDLNHSLHFVVAVLFTSYFTDVAFVPWMQLREWSVAI